MAPFDGGIPYQGRLLERVHWAARLCGATVPGLLTSSLLWQELSYANLFYRVNHQGANARAGLVTR